MGVVGEVDSAARDCPTVRVDRRDGTTPPPSHEIGKMGRKGMGKEWNGMEWNGMEWNGMEWNGMEWNGMEWNGMEWNGMEWNGMEWNGMERNGTERNGTEWNRKGRRTTEGGRAVTVTTGDRDRIYFMKESLRKKIIAYRTCRIMVSMSDS